MSISLAANDSTSREPTPAAVERVGEVGAELVEIEEVRPPARLLVDGEADADRRPWRLGMARQPRDRRHDLGHAGLVVGTEQRRAVARDDVVPDAGRELGGLGRIDHLARVSRQDEPCAVVRRVNDRG